MVQSLVSTGLFHVRFNALLALHALLEQTKPAPIRERGEREVSKCEAAKSERSPFDVGLATVNVAVHEDSDVAQNERGSAGLVLAGASKGVLGAHVTLAVMT